MRYLLDTNVISETQKDEPDDGVRVTLSTLPEENVFLSVITIIELHQGTSKLPLGRRRHTLEQWITTSVHDRFRNRIIGVDAETATRCGELLGRHHLDVRVRKMLDFMIAAIALQHDLTLVTRNVRDFQGTGVKLFNPWEATPR